MKFKLPKIKFPWVSRKQHERALAIVEMRLRDERAEHRDQYENLSAGLDRILPKLMRITGFPPNHQYPNFRLQVEFSPDFIYQAFTQGNDNRMIEYMAQRVARQIENEIKTLNFARYKEMTPARGGG